MRSPSTRTSNTASGSVAGPRRTAPVRQSNRAPCHTHSSVPSPCSTPSDIAELRVRLQTSRTAPIVPRVVVRGTPPSRRRARRRAARRPAAGGQRRHVRSTRRRSRARSAREASRSAACSVCHGMLAHFTRIGKRDTPENAASSPRPRASCSVGRSLPVHQRVEPLEQLLRLGARLSLHRLRHERRRRLARSRTPALVNRTSAIRSPVISELHRHLVAAAAGSAPRRGGSPPPAPVVVRLPVVVEDDRLVELRDRIRHGAMRPASSRRSSVAPRSVARLEPLAHLGELDRLQHLRRERVREQLARRARRRCRGSSCRTAPSRRCRPTVAPCVHFTSSAKISSCGLVSICACSESSSVLFVCLPSVFCATGWTYTLPLNTPCDAPSSIPL